MSKLCHAAIKDTADSDINPLKPHHLIGINACVGCGKALDDIIESKESYKWEGER